MKRNYRLITGQVLAPFTAWYLADVVNTHERAWGLWCAPSVCGPDDLPGVIFLASWVGLGLLAYHVTKRRY
jgi:hypothetical protein